MSAKDQKELYIQYLNEELLTLEDLCKDKSNEEKIKVIAERIEEMERIRFETRARLSVLHSEGSKAAGPGKFYELVKERGSMIDTSFKMPENNADPRERMPKPKKEEKKKVELSSILGDLGIDKAALLASIRAKKDALKKE